MRDAAFTGAQSICDVPRRRRFTRLTALLALTLLPQMLFAQLPGTRLDAVYPPGTAVDTTLELRIAGADLDDVDALFFSHPGITSERKMADPGPFDKGPQPVENEFVVTVGADVPPGEYTVRCQGRYGRSNPRTFVVTTGPELLETEPNNNAAEAVEVMTSGTVSGQLSTAADSDWFRFTAQKGQRLLITGRARTVDSRTDLVLKVMTPDEVVLSENVHGYAGDPMIDLRVPETGDYLLCARDSLYRGGAEYTYRIEFSERPHIDFVFPPAGAAGSNDEYIVYGRNLPGGKPSRYEVGGAPLEQLAVKIPMPADLTDVLNVTGRVDPHQAALDAFEYRVSGAAGRSNRALMTIASAAVVHEGNDNDRPESAVTLTPPCEVVGQFYPRRDADWYTFEAKAGQVWAMEVYSHRLGAPTDPALLIQRVEKQDDGAERITQVAWVDDAATRESVREFDHRSNDPAYLFTAPADGTYRVLVRDSYSAVHNDPRLVYRFAIRPAQPDFRVVAVPVDLAGSVLIRRGGRQGIRVSVCRQDGFDGEVVVNADALPQGVSSSPVTIGPGAESSTLILTAAEDAPAGIGSVRITATAEMNGKPVTRQARVGRPLQPLTFAQANSNVASVSARRIDELVITTCEAENALLALSIGDGKPLETSRGGIVKIPWEAVRTEGVAGSIVGFPRGLPANISTRQVNLGTNPKGEFELRLRGDTPPGTYTFHLACTVRGAQYRRNPEAFEKARVRQTELAEIQKQVNDKSRAAQQAAQQAQTAVTRADSQLRTATSQMTAASTAATTAMATRDKAAQALETARKALEASPEDAALRTQVDTATKSLNDAAAGVDKASADLASASKSLTEAQADRDAKQNAKTKADQNSQDAQQLARLAQQEKQRIDTTVRRLQQLSSRRSINFNVPSTTATLRITEFPIALQEPPDATTIRQGDKVQVRLAMKRLYDFKGNVSVQCRVPGGVSGLQVSNLNIAGGKNDGQITLTAQPTATPGTHQATLRLQMNVNGQNLTMERPLQIVVQKVEPKKS